MLGNISDWANKLKDLIPGEIDDKLIDSLQEKLGSGDINIDEAMQQITDKIPGELDNQAADKIKEMLGGGQ